VQILVLIRVEISDVFQVLFVLFHGLYLELNASGLFLQYLQVFYILSKTFTFLPADVAAFEFDLLPLLPYLVVGLLLFLLVVLQERTESDHAALHLQVLVAQLFLLLPEVRLVPKGEVTYRLLLELLLFLLVFLLFFVHKSPFFEKPRRRAHSVELVGYGQLHDLLRDGVHDLFLIHFFISNKRAN